MGSFYGRTGIVSSEHVAIREESAMTMYTEDFEDSEADDTQTSLHLASARTKSSEIDGLRQRSFHDTSSSAHSENGSVSSTRPVKSSHSPVKSKSGRLKTKIQESESVERKVDVSQDEGVDPRNVDPYEKIGLPIASNENGDENDGSYTDDFHSVGSEFENVSLDPTSPADSLDTSDRGVLDLPPAPTNLGYTY